MLPIYKIGVNDNDDETGVDFNSFVDIPAHMKAFIAFNKINKRKNFVVDDEKRLVTGVMISANTPIYRNNPTPCYVVFTPNTIEVIRKKFFKNGYVQNLNDMHNQKKMIKGATLVDSYIINNSDDRFPNVPQSMESMNLQDGTWIASYYIHENKLWSEVKSGKWGGFSVEGYFDLEPVKISNIKKKNKMAKKEKSIFDFLKVKKGFKKDEFKKAVSKDGTEYFYETGEDLADELEVGSEIYIEVDGEQIPAPEGEIELTTEEGLDILVTIDSDGIVEDLEVLDESGEQVEELLRKLVKDIDARFRKVEARQDRQEKSGKYSSHKKTTKEGRDNKKLSFRELLSQKK